MSFNVSADFATLMIWISSRMLILHLVASMTQNTESNHMKILEEIQIMTVAKSADILNEPPLQATENVEMVKDI